MKNNTAKIIPPENINSVPICNAEKVDQQYLKLLKKLETIINKIKENRFTS